MLFLLFLAPASAHELVSDAIKLDVSARNGYYYYYYYYYYLYLTIIHQ